MHIFQQIQGFAIASRFRPSAEAKSNIFNNMLYLFIFTWGHFERESSSSLSFFFFLNDI